MSLGDPGLQPQRTALAWRRTALAIFVNALLVLRAGVQSQAPLVIAAGAMLLCMALLTLGVAFWRDRLLSQDPAPTAPPVALMLATTGAACLACGAALAAINASQAL